MIAYRVGEADLVGLSGAVFSPAYRSSGPCSEPSRLWVLQRNVGRTLPPRRSARRRLPTAERQPDGVGPKLPSRETRRTDWGCPSCGPLSGPHA